MGQKSKVQGRSRDSEMILRSAVIFGIVIGVLVLYRCGVFAYVSKLYVDHAFNGMTQKAEGEKHKGK